MGWDDEDACRDPQETASRELRNLLPRTTLPARAHPGMRPNTNVQQVNTADAEVRQKAGWGFRAARARLACFSWGLACSLLLRRSPLPFLPHPPCRHGSSWMSCAQRAPAACARGLRTSSTKRPTPTAC